MRLKSLKLAGFKSFANPTTFTFRHGITAIVGPNGCGKSNVIDAIRWVLGESSAKQLRGGAMSDVIFAGTESKAAKSVASVELTFEHTQDEQTGIRHELNLYHELSIRRQINLEGKSDYFINGTRCRRRDVIDVFLGTGLGSRSYAVIQQGMIGRIVDSSPMQLREFIEEAAGVSRYQARREETQKKLETTKDNLARLEDVRSELARQQKSLAKQAESAGTYQGLKEELSQVQQKLAIAQLTEAKLQELSHKAEQERISKQVEASSDQVASLKAKLSKLESRMAEAQWLKDDAQDRYHQHELARQQAAHQLTSLQEKIAQSERRIDGLQSQIERSDSELATFNQQYNEQSTRLEELTPKFAALEQQLAEQKASQAPLDEQWQAVNAQINEVQSQLRVLEQQQALHQQAQSQLRIQREKWQRQDSRWREQSKQLAVLTSASISDSDANTTSSTKSVVNRQDDNLSESVSPESLAEQIQQIKATLNSLDRQKDDLQERLAGSQPQLSQLTTSLAEQRQSQQSLEKRHATLSGEYDSLHRMLHSPTLVKQRDLAANSATKPVAVKSSAAQQDTMLTPLIQLPTLSETIELSKVGKAYSEVLDYWLTMWFDSIIIATQSGTAETSAQSLTGALQSLYSRKLTTSGGNKNPQSPSKNNAQPQGQPQLTSDPSTSINSVLFPADLAQSGNPEVSDTIALTQLIAKPQLSVWQHCYLYTGELQITNDQGANDQDDANPTKAPKSLDSQPASLQHTLSQLPQGSILLTATGWLISQTMAVHLSKLTGKGDATHHSQFLTQRLQQQQRLAELEEALTEVEDDLESSKQSIKTTQAKYDELAVTVEELNAQAASIVHSEYQQQRRLTTLQSQFERQQAEQSRLQAERDTLDTEYQELEQAKSNLEAQITTTQAKLADIEPQLTELQQRQSTLAEERAQHQQLLQADTTALQELRFEIKEATLAATHANEQRNKISAQHAHFIHSLQSLQQTLAGDQAKLPQLVEAQKGADQACHEQLIALDEHKASLSGLKAEHGQEQSQLETVQSQWQSQQNQLAEVATQVAIFAERIRDASERLDATDSAVSAATILTEIVAYGGQGRRLAKQAEDQQQLHQREAQLSSKLAKMGPVNLAAAAELEEVNARLLPLEEQINDITASMDTLIDAIVTIDTKTKTLFMQTLDAVNEDLASLFAKVFGGGRAQLSLQDDDSLAKAEKWRAGIELMAQPKGKKNSRLAVLSGGEKTLTALSLIFAIFKQHPAPFCVLDEVDAPLDDANVARFTGLIHELADDVQFIFISHNKLAMQIADELKGITMPQAGISTLVSVSLEEAEKYIEA